MRRRPTGSSTSRPPRRSTCRSAQAAGRASTASATTATARRPASARSTGDEIAASREIVCAVNANLVDMRLDDGLGTMTEARFKSFTPGDPGFAVRARVFALCCGGLENPRLLLACNSQLPNGIGNRHDWSAATSPSICRSCSGRPISSGRSRRRRSRPRPRSSTPRPRPSWRSTRSSASACGSLPTIEPPLSFSSELAAQRRLRDPLHRAAGAGGARPRARLRPRRALHVLRAGRRPPGGAGAGLGDCRAVARPRQPGHALGPARSLRHAAHPLRLADRRDRLPHARDRGARARRASTPSRASAASSSPTGCSSSRGAPRARPGQPGRRPPPHVLDADERRPARGGGRRRLQGARRLATSTSAARASSPPAATPPRPTPSCSWRSASATTSAAC